jgi:hypothetical protein
MSFRETTSALIARAPRRSEHYRGGGQPEPSATTIGGEVPGAATSLRNLNRGITLDGQNNLVEGNFIGDGDRTTAWQRPHRRRLADRNTVGGVRAVPPTSSPSTVDGQGFTTNGVT